MSDNDKKFQIDRREGRNSMKVDCNFELRSHQGVVLHRPYRTSGRVWELLNDGERKIAGVLLIDGVEEVSFGSYSLIIQIGAMFQGQKETVVGRIKAVMAQEYGAIEVPFQPVTS